MVKENSTIDCKPFLTYVELDTFFENFTTSLISLRRMFIGTLVVVGGLYLIQTRKLLADLHFRGIIIELVWISSSLHSSHYPLRLLLLSAVLFLTSLGVSLWEIALG